MCVSFSLPRSSLHYFNYAAHFVTCQTRFSIFFSSSLAGGYSVCRIVSRSRLAVTRLSRLPGRVVTTYSYRSTGRVSVQHVVKDRAVHSSEFPRQPRRLTMELWDTNRDRSNETGNFWRRTGGIRLHTENSHPTRSTFSPHLTLSCPSSILKALRHHLKSSGHTIILLFLDSPRTGTKKTVPNGECRT